MVSILEDIPPIMYVYNIVTPIYMLVFKFLAEIFCACSDANRGGTILYLLFKKIPPGMESGISKSLYCNGGIMAVCSWIIWLV